MQPSCGRAVAFGGRGRPGLCRDGHRDGFVREERQLVALAVRDQADERHRGQQGGCRYVCPAGEERSQRGVDARSRPGRLCRLGLDVGRYTTPVCHVESRASGRRDERDGAPQVGGGIERGGRDSGEAFGADQRAVSRIRDAQVEGGGFRRGDGVTEFPAERGVLRRNLCECHLDRCLGCCCGGLHDVARCRSQRAGRSVACP